MRRVLALLVVQALLICANDVLGAAGASESIAVVVPRGTKQETPTKTDLVIIYERKKLFWADGTRIEPVNLPASHAVRRSFSQLVLGQTPEEIEGYWNDMYFHGVLPPYVLGSEEAVLRFVAKVPGAIGYVPYCHADKRVSVLAVLNAAGNLVAPGNEPACTR